MHLDTVSHHTFPFFLYRAGPHRDLHSSLHDALPICEVPARGPEDDDGTSGHVLATVVVDALDDRRRTRVPDREARSEEHTSELSHVSISYAVFCLKKKKTNHTTTDMYTLTR